MKEKKKFSPLWLIPAAVIVALILWCIYFPLNMFTGLDEDVEPSVATVMVHVFDGENPRFDATEAQQLSEIMAQLKTVRCRFFGWSNIMNISAEKPTIDFYITGYEGETPFGLHLSVNGRNEIRIWTNNVSLRAKDAALYEYLTELVKSSEEATALNDGWNYTPSDNVIETVVSAILGEGEKDYCRSVVFHEAELDWDAREWAIKQYTDYKDGWTEEYLQENMMAVTASYTVDYDGRKTFLPSGKFERVFFLLWNAEIQKWEIWENTTAAPVEDTEEPPAVQESTVDPSLYEQAQTQTFSFSDTLSVQVSHVIKTETRILPAEDNFEYEVYTVLPGAEIEVLHAAVEDTVELGPLGIWKIYNKDGNKQYIEPNMPNISITENTNGIGAESVCILVFELYTGEDTAT